MKNIFWGVSFFIVLYNFRLRAKYLSKVGEILDEILEFAVKKDPTDHDIPRVLFKISTLLAQSGFLWNAEGEWILFYFIFCFNGEYYGIDVGCKYFVIGFLSQCYIFDSLLSLERLEELRHCHFFFFENLNEEFVSKSRKYKRKPLFIL